MSDEASVYLDHNATTPLDPDVLEVMLPLFREGFANPASRQHAAGRRAAEVVEAARKTIAEALGADPREIVFTSGATESNNLALQGTAGAPAYARKKHIVTVATEHRAVLDPAFGLEERGYDVTVLGVDAQGRVDLAAIAGALRDETLLASVMFANNETGVLQSVAEIGALCRERRVLFHTDATQALGKEPIDVEAQKIDLLSVSAHKVYGPKGVGALFVRRRSPRVRLKALLEGGGHERGMRSGTLNVPGIAGFARAVEIAVAGMGAERTRVGGLRDALERDLMRRLPGVRRNGPEAGRLAGTSNLSFEGCDAESLLVRLPEVAASSASACTSAAIQPSHVLGAMGLTQERIDGSVRFSLGRGTTAAEVTRAVELIATAVERERAEGPRPGCRL